MPRPAAKSSADDALSTTRTSAKETRPGANTVRPVEVDIEGRPYTKAPYAPPQVGALYCVRDKAHRERIVRVTGKSADGARVQVQILDGPTQQVEFNIDSLARQAAKGWCSLLRPAIENSAVQVDDSQPPAANPAPNVAMRLDIQNFSRCCADIARANIRFDTQLIKDIGDGPFRAGNYEQAFRLFEQCAVGFGSAVATSRRAIADGRRRLTAEKGKLSGKEIQERTAAFVRSEQLIHAAEREFSTILEGLRMYLRSQQDEQ
jgi:hypothetical protein